MFIPAFNLLDKLNDFLIGNPKFIRFLNELHDEIINASLRMYKSDWIRMYNFDFNMHTDFEVKWCACKFENHNRD